MSDISNESLPGRSLPGDIEEALTQPDPIEAEEAEFVYSVGDVVVLRSGSPALTVNKLYTDMYAGIASARFDVYLNGVFTTVHLPLHSVMLLSDFLAEGGVLAPSEEDTDE